MQFPPGTYGRIASRSGLAKKRDITVPTGLIDPDYRGNISVLLHNTSTKNNFEVSMGDRIAQIVIERYVHVNIKEMTGTIPPLEKNNKRNKAGWGSTGKK